MGLGSHNQTQKTFLTVGFGKIRQKSLENKQRVDANTPGAVKRLTQSGAESWALEHDYISGLIENIFYKEDAEFGNSFEVTISDKGEKYQLSFSEESRFWIDFMKKLPNIDLLQELKITAYDFTDKENKHKAGISVIQNDVKITSYYEHKKEDGKWDFLHGFPSSTGIDFKDKDELKMYFIKVKKFLRGEFNRLFASTFSTKKENKPLDEPEIHSDFDLPGVEPDSDLPF